MLARTEAIGRGRRGEKGIDVRLALDVVRLAHREGRLDSNRSVHMRFLRRHAGTIERPRDREALTRRGRRCRDIDPGRRNAWLQ